MACKHNDLRLRITQDGKIKSAKCWDCRSPLKTKADLSKQVKEIHSALTGGDIKTDIKPDKK